MIYFITVNYYSTELISHLICSLPKSSELIYKVLIVNNSSEDTSINELRSDSVLIIDSSTNVGFGGACNLGLNWVYSQDPCGLVWLINPDACLLENSIEKAINLFGQYPEISIAGTTIYTQSGEIWFAGGDFNAKTGSITSQEFIREQDSKYFVSEWASGCSLIINLGRFQICPHFDSVYFLYYEDFDFCKRYASQGHLIVVAPHISVIHKPSSITNKNIVNKLKCSTYSYLLTLQKYTSPFTLLFRLTRIFLYAIILLPIKPREAFGKLYGVFLYLKHWI
jgi:N-acetylglucosaminyl-diphospho-decaprenol L-rhamnosyltransferase